MTNALGYTLLAMCSLVLSACGNSANENVHTANKAHSHGVPEVVPGVWPPVLSNIENQRLLPTPRRSQGASVLIAVARNSVMSNPNVLTQLGNRFTELEASVGDAKSGTVANFLFYNYTTDQTVSVALLSNGSIDQKVYNASSYQPAENSEEISTAVSLAIEAMTDDGVDLAEFKGTAMLAFPASSESASEDRLEFYPQRLLYVTFGEGDGIEPEYQALVNLSQASVVEYGLIRQ